MEFNQKYYQTYYKNYKRQNPTYKLNFYLETVQRFAPKSQNLLDAGCAFGAFLLLAQSSYQVYGFDISNYSISQAAKKLPKANLKVSSVETVTFPTKFGVITLFDVIEHVVDLEKALSSLSNQLSKNGVIILVMPVYDGLTGKIVRLLDKDPSHINKFSRQKWLEILSKDFDILHWQGVFRYFFLKRLYLHFPTKNLRQFSPAIIVVAKKKA